MIVVSDTMPLISLMKASRLDVLQKLFGEVFIPTAVFRELTSNESFREEARQITECSFIRVVCVNETKAVDVLRRSTGLDLGESEAIIYADDNKAQILLMDEAKGRQVAKAMGLFIMGTVGVLLAAFDEKILSGAEAEAALQRLKQSNRRISETLLQAALEKIK